MGAVPDQASYVEREPSELLRRIVRKLWYLDAPTPSAVERILPIPYVHAIVNLGEPYEVIARGTTPDGRSFPAGFVSGLQSTYLVNRNPERVCHVGAELEPFAWRSLGLDPFADDVRPADQVLPALMAVRESVLRASPEEAIAGLEGALAAALTGAAPDEVAERVARVIASDPDQPMGRVAETVGASASSLARRFRRATGTTPKAHADVHRFNRFLERLAVPGDLPTLAQMAAETGYYDQPHFIKSFTRFSGVSPRAYLRALGEVGRGAPSFVYLEG